MAKQHVIIGGGPVATNAIETIREFDGGQSEITLISDEPAHSRMALPYWLAGKIPQQQVHTGDDAYFQKLGVETQFGKRVTQVDPQANTVTLDDGSALAFDDLLIGTGSSPLKLDIPGIDLPGVQPLWTIEQTQQALDRVAGKEKPRVLMIGAGFIGFIMLNAMYKRGWQLAVVEREGHILPRMLDDGSAGIVEKWLNARGVQLHTGATVTAIRDENGEKVVQLDSGLEVKADLVVVAIGIRPNLGLIDGSGIETDEGILVNDQMQTNFAQIYAGGDVAQGPVLSSDQRQIHAIQPTAVDHGRVAGANMAGQEVHYPGSLLMNVVDVCGLQTASFGNWASGDDEVTIANQDGFVYRKILFSGDQISGAIFAGKANDLGMLNDVGMVKGFLQTQTPLGPWKQFLQENPFDIRRPYVATRVAEKLAGTTLLGRPARPRQYQFGGAKPGPGKTAAHSDFVSTKQD